MPGSDVFTGTLDLLILRALSAEPKHGYAIGRWLRDTSGQVLRVEEGALYPALYRLARTGLVATAWGETELGRRGKFYRLTRKGRKRLELDEARWREHVRAVEAILAAPGV